MNKPEVLSPVGNRAMLEAAVRAGADAVYFGAREFSARRNAENFDLPALREAVAYCHIRGVKCYLALNTLIKEAEFPRAVQLANDAFSAGIDGAIIADLGLAAVLHRLLPDLPLHASTQCSILSPAALPLAKAAGFCRVVAGRELSKKELSEFCRRAAELEVEVEVFVHGALCMSVSGQCLLSAFLGSRSGNRGLCAGPCRLPFSAQNGTGYDLSLKDLSLLPHIGELTEMGVSSLKIEGRLKRPEYVTAATTAVRSAVDTGSVPPAIDAALRQVFSRSGFTDGYFQEQRGRSMFGVRTKEDVTAANRVFPALHELVRAERQSVPVTVDLTVKKEEPLCLTLSDGVHSVTVKGSLPQPAKTKAATAETLAASVDKFGGTPYLATVSAKVDDGLFFPNAELNTLRRKAVSLLDEERAKPRLSAHISYQPRTAAFATGQSPAFYLRCARLEQIPGSLDGIDTLILPLELTPPVSLPKVRTAVELPRAAAGEETVRKQLSLWKQAGVRSAFCGTLAALQLARSEGFTVSADSGMNLLNSESLYTIATFGACEAVLSGEVTLRGAQDLSSPIPKGVIVYGKIPLMLFRNCPIQNGNSCKDCRQNGILTDRKGVSFPVRCRSGYSELFNPLPIWSADRRNDWKTLDFAVFYFTDESPEQVFEVLTAYQNGSASTEHYTRGLLYRGSL